MTTKNKLTDGRRKLNGGDLKIEDIKKMIDEEPESITLEKLAEPYNISKQWLSILLMSKGFDYMEYKRESFDKHYKPKVVKEIKALIDRYNGRITNKELRDKLGLTSNAFYKCMSREELQEYKKIVRDRGI